MESARGLSVGDLSPKYGDRKKTSPRSGSDTRPDSRDSGPPRSSGQRAGSTVQPGQDGEPSSPLMSELIKTWLTVAEPPENATRGAHLQYTMRGNVVGTVPGGIITSRHETGGFDPVYLWSERRKLDSVNHCTMEEFVNACVQNKSIAHCQGRYKPVPPPPLDDFKGMKASAARTAVQGKGLVPIVRESEPAPERGLERTVISQHPKPKTLLKRGETVELAVYGPYKALTTVLGVRGKSAAEARQMLASSGLNPAFEPGEPAPNPGLDNRVQRTDPPEGERVQKGTTVIVKLYTPHVSPGAILPDFSGQSLSEARKWLASNKLQASLQPGSPAPTAQKSGTIEKQGIAPGTKVAQGETITLTVHSGFVELRKVPDVVGLSAAEAKRRMSAMGLSALMKAGGTPSSRERAGTGGTTKPRSWSSGCVRGGSESVHPGTFRGDHCCTGRRRHFLSRFQKKIRFGGFDHRQAGCGQTSGAALCGNGPKARACGGDEGVQRLSRLYLGVWPIHSHPRGAGGRHGLLAASGEPGVLG